MESRKDRLRAFVTGLITKTESVVWNIKEKESIVLKTVVSNPTVESEGLCQEIYHSTFSLLQNIYGKESPQAHNLNGRHDTFLMYDDSRFFDPGILLPACHGKLKGILNDIDNSLIDNIESQVSGEIFGNFLSTASQALDNGHKEIAAVVASAALEDLLKKIGELNGLDVRTKAIQKVVNALTGKELLKGSSAKLIDKYTFIRDKALHAQWDKFQVEEVRSMIAFMEGLITVHFAEK